MGENGKGARFFINGQVQACSQSLPILIHKIEPLELHIPLKVRVIGNVHIQRGIIFPSRTTLEKF
jgi:hypothetical protein